MNCAEEYSRPLSEAFSGRKRFCRGSNGAVLSAGESGEMPPSPYNWICRGDCFAVREKN